MPLPIRGGIFCCGGVVMVNRVFKVTDVEVQGWIEGDPFRFQRICYKALVKSGVCKVRLPDEVMQHLLNFLVEDTSVKMESLSMWKDARSVTGSILESEIRGVTSRHPACVCVCYALRGETAKAVAELKRLGAIEVVTTKGFIARLFGL